MSTMVEILERIIETRGAGCVHGLCYELLRADDSYLVDSLFETWEHYSGNIVFPVPDPDCPGDPDKAAGIFMRLGPGDGFLGDYGELRLKLAQHLLEALR